MASRIFSPSSSLWEILRMPARSQMQKPFLLAKTSTAKRSSTSVAVVKITSAPARSAKFLATSLAPPKCQDRLIEEVSEGAVLSEDMRTQAQAVSGDIEATNQIITDLVAQIQGVSSITDAILSISSQTNLLALNASIEAARAGEAGKGFAVVADEIRTLAEQTKNSTEEITQIMNQLISVANQSVEKMNHCVEGIQLQNTKIADVNSSFEQTKDNVGKLKTMVDGIIDGVNEVSNNTAKIVDSVVSVSENTNRVSELSGNGVDGAVMIYDTIQDFSDTIGRLHGKVEKLQDTISNEQ